MHCSTKISRAILLVTASVVAAAAAHAEAQPQSDAGAQTQAVSGQLEEIVVTAQKRGQNLQDVPVSVTAFSAATIDRVGLARASEIAKVDPSIKIGTSNSVVLPFIRGIGNFSATNIGNESSVPVYIDDVYYSRLQTAYLELNNVERIEVLKGPQGTLFGRNASGGAVQIYTRDPGDQLALEAKAGLATYLTYTGKLYVAAPLTDSVRADLSVSGQRQERGWGKFILTGKKNGYQNFINIRSKIVADLSETSQVHLIGYYIKTRGNIGVLSDRLSGTLGGTPSFENPPGSGQFTSIYGAILPMPAAAQAAKFYDSTSNEQVIDDHEGYGGSLKIDQDLGFANLVSISAYRRAREYYLAEGDQTIYNWLRYDLYSRDRQISQEFQLKASKESKIQWIVGLYYLNSKQGYLPTRVSGDAITIAGGLRSEIFGDQTVKSYSAYSQATFPVADVRTNVTLGLRYNKDDVHGEGRTDFVTAAGTFPGQVPFDDTYHFHKLTYKAAIDHHFNDDVMSYVTFSRGYKSGTFNTLPLASPPNKSEVVDAYEIGVKSQLFDRRLRFNAAVFQNDIKNPQVQTSTRVPGGTAAFIGLQNGKKAKVRGAEFNADAVLAPQLTARLGGTYLDAKYTDFDNAVSYAPRRTIPYGLASPQVIDAKGNRLALVPKWRFSGGLNYDVDSSIGHFNVDVNASYTGKFFWNADNLVSQGPVTLVDATLTYQPAGSDQFSVQLWTKNLFNKHYYTGELDVEGGSGNIAAYGAPRTIGIELRYKL